MSSYTPDGTHALADFVNAFAAMSSTPVLTFNLNGLYDLSGMVVWNYNNVPEVGVKDVRIYGSTDGITYELLLDAPTVFALAPQTTTQPGEAFNFATTAAYIRFDVLSNQNGSMGYAGLDEVMFEGNPHVNAVPEPSTWAALCAGAGVLGLATLRRRTVRA